MVEVERRPGDRARLFGAPRWLVILAGAVAALILVGYVTLKVLFPPQKLRAMVVPRIEAAVGRDVELNAVRLKIFPRIAVRLEDLIIANPPGFSQEPAVRLEALELQVGFWPLLRRQFDLRQVRLLSPNIRYEVLADGTSNLAGMVGREADPAAGAGGRRATPGGAASSLFVSDLVLTNGTLLYSDARRGRGARMGLEARASAERAAGAGRALTSSGRVDLVAIRALAPNLGPDSVSLSDVKVEYELFADLPGDSVRLGSAARPAGRAAPGGRRRAAGPARRPLRRLRPGVGGGGRGKAPGKFAAGAATRGPGCVGGGAPVAQGAGPDGWRIEAGHQRPDRAARHRCRVRRLRPRAGGGCGAADVRLQFRLDTGVHRQAARPALRATGDGDRLRRAGHDRPPRGRRRPGPAVPASRLGDPGVR